MKKEDAKRPAATEGTQHDTIPTPESCLSLPNVTPCIEKLTALLQRHPDRDSFVMSAKQLLYDMLTRRSEFVQRTQGAGIDTATYMRPYELQKKWYQETRVQIEKMVDAAADYKWESNPAWFGVNTHPEKTKGGEVDIKVYATIPTTEYAFLQNLPALMKELRQLSIATDDIIQVKIPGSLTGFLASDDSVVIHFKKKENATRVQEILTTWMSTHDIHEEPREMGRTKLAADPKGSSFTDAVAENIATWLEENSGQYDATTLAKEAVKHAISQSQQTPFTL